MYWIWKTLAKITIVVTCISGDDESHQIKRTHFTDNFNVLLDLYKMNPLKKSNIYKAFSSRILLNRNDKGDLKYDFNETVFNQTKATLSVKQLENIISANNSGAYVNKPTYDVENIDSEKFTVDRVIESSNRKKDRDSTFGNLESVEDDHIPVTKMLPVNNTNSIALLHTNSAFAESHIVSNGYENEIYSTILDHPTNTNNVTNDNTNIKGTEHENWNNLFENGVVILR